MRNLHKILNYVVQLLCGNVITFCYDIIMLCLYNYYIMIYLYYTYTIMRSLYYANITVFHYTVIPLC